jgi:hypothetical protein
MADQIKEISNGTYGVGALSNGVPIASTDADTQYVVKDIHVQNNTLPTVSAGLNFVVNGVAAANIGTSVSGSEIVDVSSTAVAQVTADFQLRVFENWMVTNTTSSRINTQTSRLVNGAVASSVLTQSAQITNGLSNSGTIVSWATIGSNFYYWISDGNVTQALYRRAGGIDGTQTTIPNMTVYTPAVFDGVDKFHWITASQVWTHNATANTTTAVNLDTTGVSWAASVSSHPRISFTNGLIFWSHSESSGTWAINPSTGKMSYIATSIATAANTAFGVYHTGGTYYILYTDDTSAANTGAIYVRTISDTIVGPLTSANTTGSSTAVYGQAVYTPRNALSAHWPKISPNGEFVFLSVESTSAAYVYKRFNVVTRTFATPYTLDASTIVPSAGGSYQLAPFRTLSITNDSANKLNTTFYPQTATLRVTGVETTL